MEHRCNLIIDSCCDLPFEVVDREGVELIEFPYVTSEGERADDLYRSTSAHEFFQAMREGEQPTTSQVPMHTYREVFGRAVESGVPTVALVFSSGLSGSYDAAALVRDEILAEDRGMTASELARWAEEARFFVDAEFMVDDLEALRRGGRIPGSVAYAGSKLDVKPLLTIGVDGKLALSGVARGRKKGLKQLAEYYRKRAAKEGPGKHVVIGNADCEKDADRLKEALSKDDDSILFLESSIGPVIGSHVGPGMIAVVFWGGDKREELSVADRIAKRVRGAE